MIRHDRDVPQTLEEAEAEVAEGRLYTGDVLCPKSKHAERKTAVRCYHPGCDHLFDPDDGSNDVLCPCCA